MQIRSVLGGYSDTSALARRAEMAETEERRRVEQAVAEPIASPGPRETLIEVLSRYDVADMTPSDYSEMIQELHDGGAISDEEFQQLATVRVDLDNEGIDPDESFDLLEFYMDQVADMRRELDGQKFDSPESEKLSVLLRRLDWMQKFSTIQSSPDSVGLDTMA